MMTISDYRIVNARYSTTTTAIVGMDIATSVTSRSVHSQWNQYDTSLSPP